MRHGPIQGTRADHTHRPLAGVLTAVLRDLPDLPGAACAGHEEALWDDRIGRFEDPKQRLERHRKARLICSQCPVLTECAKAALKQSARATHACERPRGIWAGVLLHPEPPPQGAQIACKRPACSRPFVPQGPAHRYCTAACQLKASRERRREAAKRMRSSV